MLASSAARRQYAVYAVCRRCARRALLGAFDWRLRCLTDALGSEFGCRRGLGRKDALDEISRGRPRNAFLRVICLQISDAAGLSDEDREAAPKRPDLLVAEGVALGSKGHREAPPHLRIWGGPTVDPDDIEKRSCHGSIGHSKKSTVPKRLD